MLSVVPMKTALVRHHAGPRAPSPALHSCDSLSNLPPAVLLSAMLFFSFLLILLTLDVGEVSSWTLNGPLEVTKCCVNHTIAAKLQLDVCKCSHQWANSEEALVLLLFFVHFFFFSCSYFKRGSAVGNTLTRVGSPINGGQQKFIQLEGSG